LFEPQHAAVLTALGTCYIQLDQANKAVPYFEQVAGLVPEVFEAQNNLGVAYTLTGQYAEAELACRRALEIDGENLAAWKNLAQVCLQQENRLSLGVQILAALAQFHPEDSGVMVMMANVCMDGGDLSSAELFFKQALKIDPGHQDASAGLAQIAEQRFG
jgi:cytochrome c-type biogenesis protein CcmH/NrfG